MSGKWRATRSPEALGRPSLPGRILPPSVRSVSQCANTSRSSVSCEPQQDSRSGRQFVDDAFRSICPGSEFSRHGHRVGGRGECTPQLTDQGAPAGSAADCSNAACTAKRCSNSAERARHHYASFTGIETCEVVTAATARVVATDAGPDPARPTRRFPVRGKGCHFGGYVRCLAIPVGVGRGRRGYRR